MSKAQKKQIVENYGNFVDRRKSGGAIYSSFDQRHITEYNTSENDSRNIRIASHGVIGSLSRQTSQSKHLGQSPEGKIILLSP